MKKLVILRRSSQFLFLALFIYILWSATYPDAFFKINPLIMIFTSISERIILPGAIFAIVMLALTLVFGRFFCGWICPLGTIIDLCGVKALQKKAARSIKFYILGAIAVSSFLGIQIAWIFDPIVITARFVSLNLIPGVTFGLDRVFKFFIIKTDYYTPLYDFYRLFKSSVLGINTYYFSHSGMILIFFVLICLSVLIAKRFWCRAICPLGAIYSLVARFSPLSRVVEKCTNCLRCKEDCRMGAINEDLSCVKGECILCMDCIYDCPTHGTKFTWSLPPQPRRLPAGNLRGCGGNLSRREFIFLMFASFLSLGFRNKMRLTAQKLIRPPAALKEGEFLDRCIRCGNCMKVCVTNGLQPAIFESGLQGMWTPHLVPEIGYCEYTCTLCGNVCPTGAIPKLNVEEKKRTRLGIAKVDRSKCLAWSENIQCIVCEEHCPVANKAIKVIEEDGVLKPYVDPGLCIGCGICQNKCPARPERAIKVSPEKSSRS
ncbi:MAG: 4Fe-4S binding protein [Candidatus Omnitrophica bacterium]|nr:4Fe-4S binding protein [Candidatus Omnitrophota bacterium]